jgi:hypothetical protein
MKKKLPSGKTLGIWIGAIALAVFSIPSPTTFRTVTSQSHVSHYLPAHTDALPTMAVPVQGPTEQVTHKQADDGHKTAPAKPKQHQESRDNSAVGNRNQRPAPTSKPKQAPRSHSRAVPETQNPSRAVTPRESQSPAPGSSQAGQEYTPFAPLPTSKLRLRVIDGRSQQPLPGAEVVIIETEQRMTTDQDGYTAWTDVPVLRDPRYRPLVQELHGQLGVIAYKNGYRDSIHLGIRMHEGLKAESTVWMYKLGPGDTRIEPVLYQVPYHHLWLVELADRFRSKSQLGEGPERP